MLSVLSSRFSARSLRAGVVALTAAALLWCAPAVSASTGAERSQDFVRNVNRGIDRGAEWLLKQQRMDGTWPGYERDYPVGMTAIAYHTLRTCGTPRSDRRMVAAYNAMRRDYVKARDDDKLRTYSAALIMMAIADDPVAGSAAKKSGRGLRYGNQTKQKKSKGLSDRDRAWMHELVEFMELNQTPFGAWRYGRKVSRYEAREPSYHYDHSNTQYALLGLKAASRSGVEVNKDVYLRALEHLILSQEEKGPRVARFAVRKKGETFAKAVDQARGWGYYSFERGTRIRSSAPDGQQATGSMTSGAVGAIVICRSELLGKRGYSSRLDARAETSIWDGLAWLGRNFSVTENPGRGGWHFYYLYGLERAGILGGVELMGEHDWYGEGAQFLLDDQRRDGEWNGSELDTCYALLFLKRGTRPVARGAAITPSGGGNSIRFDGAADLGEKDFEDFVDLVVSRWNRTRDGAVRDELLGGMVRVGARIVPSLIKRMGAGDEMERAAAYAILVDATGLMLAYDPLQSAEQRMEDLVAWEVWFMTNQKRLRLDPETGHLTVR